MGRVTGGFGNHTALPVANTLCVWTTKERIRLADLGKPTQYLIFVIPVCLAKYV